ncbi:membrane-associated protein, putative [Bodo saltans]|uniref:Leishmanolysin-like peptidase n=1 Tax=Bodo saltans TaxID=75058 RepID=A0A0S4IM11_BODSA|nr:membrane-associated protein, putative [Bodo saltans]|eukprot:CUF36130.1 membrane-associated protein, putative [Bodo saltans]
MNMIRFRFAFVGAAALLWLVATVLGCAVQTNTTVASIVANSTTLCGQPTIEFQTLLANTKNFSRVILLNTAATAFTGTNFRLDYHQLPSLVSLRGRVLNRVGSHMVVAGCQDVQQVISTVIGNRTVCCQSAHLLDEVSVSRIGLLVQLVLDRLASVIMVDFISTTPIFINSSYHTCPIPQNYQLWNFDSDLTNFGVVVTAFPHSSSSTSSLVWERVPMWALPCAWDTRHRPVVAMLNVNPEWLGREESDAIVMQEIQHHLLHALGFDATHDHADSGLPSGSINSDIPSTSCSVKSTWETNLGKYVVYWNASTITAASTTCTTVGIPMDDEYELATLGAYPTLLSQSSNPFAAQAPWGSHYETRVMGTTDIMSSSEVGRHSWNISVVTKELFQSLRHAV